MKRLPAQVGQAKGNRLSVFPVTAAQWKLLLSLEKKS